MPQPDVVLLVPSDDQYESGLPGPESVLLLVEVSDTTLEYDSETKLPLYARNAIPEVWIVNLVHESIEVFRDPSGDGFQSHQTFGRGQAISLRAFPDVELVVEKVVGA
jgi:Uma2 family endonuclease